MTKRGKIISECRRQRSLTFNINHIRWHVSFGERDSRWLYRFIKKVVLTRSQERHLIENTNCDYRNQNARQTLHMDAVIRCLLMPSNPL